MFIWKNLISEHSGKVVNKSYNEELQVSTILMVCWREDEQIFFCYNTKTQISSIKINYNYDEVDKVAVAHRFFIASLNPMKKYLFL